MSHRKIAIILISGFIITGILVSVIFLTSTNASCVLHLIQGRQYDQPPPIKHTSLNVESIWSLKIYTPTHGLTQSDNSLFVLDSNCNEIASFDKATGEIKWTSVFGNPVDIVIDRNEEVIYVYGGWGWVQALSAHNAETGSELWSNTSRSFQRGTLIPYILPNNELFVYLSPQGDYLPVNLQNGQFGEPADVSHINYLIEDGLSWQVMDARLWARDLETGNVVWTSHHADLPACCLKQLYSTDKTIVLRFSDKLIGLESQSGNLAWIADGDDFASNFSADENHIYILNNETQLLLLDLLTGTENNRIQFTLSAEETYPPTNDHLVARESWLSSITDGYISIYFQQARELSTYRIIH